MEFIEAMKIKKRMCEYYAEGCVNCPLTILNNDTEEPCHEFIVLYPEKAEEILTKWAKEHPQKTILMDFLEKYPNAPLSSGGAPKYICPYSVGYVEECDSSFCKKDCTQCWNRPLED